MKKVFLGGTISKSKWRDAVINKLKIDYFNPIVEDWNENAQQEEIRQRKECNFVLYVLSPRMEGVYSIAEVVDDSNKRPEKTVFCYLKADNSVKDDVRTWSEHQLKSMKMVANMVEENGATVCADLTEVVNFLNSKT